MPPNASTLALDRVDAAGCTASGFSGVVFMSFYLSHAEGRSEAGSPERSQTESRTRQSFFSLPPRGSSRERGCCSWEMVDTLPSPRRPQRFEGVFVYEQGVFGLEPRETSCASFHSALPPCRATGPDASMAAA